MSEDESGFDTGISRANPAFVPDRPSVELEKLAGTEHVPEGGYVVSSRARPQVRVEKYMGGKLTYQGVAQQVRDPDGGTSTITQPIVGANTAFEAIPQPTGRLSAPAPEVIPQVAPQVQQFTAGPHLVVAPVQPPAPPPRKRVVLSGKEIGKMTLFCSGLAVSDTLVVIQYPNDGQTAIYEPPICTDENPLTVLEGTNKYQCISGGWSVELSGQYLVMLPRLPDAT